MVLLVFCLSSSEACCFIWNSHWSLSITWLMHPLSIFEETRVRPLDEMALCSYNLTLVIIQLSILFLLVNWHGKWKPLSSGFPSDYVPRQINSGYPIVPCLGLNQTVPNSCMDSPWTNPSQISFFSIHNLFIGSNWIGTPPINQEPRPLLEGMASWYFNLSYIKPSWGKAIYSHMDDVFSYVWAKWSLRIIHQMT